ncbi:MaoC/PaaZ C-terminal domain-containing protein [Streptomyces sp. TG1A-8]|uniref:MaoC/PaaZ C-terminal domain-containing protein n=1 Tax=Streptomyces sp. TG1A-8 TaxID=3051385 RepID=UPI00265B9EF8|nr:MaoC/PaaZ C-terminal domain-containing protein [Streptomyces sp. TG1A-8]MDO0927952.1 MaoC/PaaZ C-terminal domain-containing protein [Streptomyces sp. TG1A-8]
MPIDAAKALAAAPRSGRIAWTAGDVLLYHLGIGAGMNPDATDPATDPGELRYALETRLRVLPSFATVAGAGAPGVISGLSMPGVDVDPATVLHGGQRLEVHRPVPAEGTAATTDRITAVHDKGTATVLVLRTEAADADGPLWTSEAEIFVRGEGGRGGDRGPVGRRPEPPAGPPDRTVERPTRPDQALLYRLSGDRNLLHADPAFAGRAGFDRPILHGLCTYGITLKAVVDTLLDGEVTPVRSCAARFTGVVYPGETLRVRMWRQAGERAGGGDGSVRVAVSAVERDDAPVLTGTVVLRP